MHQATFRNPGRNVVRERQRPSELRDLACARLWGELCQDPSATNNLREMQARAEAAAME